MPLSASALEPLQDYADLLGAEAVHILRKLAEPLRGACILHISISASDTHNGRALSATVPLLRELGLDVRLVVPAQTREFHEFSARLLAAIQGDERAWNSSLERYWRRYAVECASQFGRHADLVIVHDPHLLPARSALASRPIRRGRWLWHCHMDLRDAEPHVFAMLRESMTGYLGVAVELPEFAGEPPLDVAAVIPPVIDPQAERNQELPAAVVDAALRHLGIRPDLPLVVQVSPFDRWDDPQWAVTTYQKAAAVVRDLQWALVWTPDFPQGPRDEPFGRLSQAVHENPSMHLLRKSGGR